MRCAAISCVAVLLLCDALLASSLRPRQFVFVFSNEHLSESSSASAATSEESEGTEGSNEWDEFGDSESLPDVDYDQGSWLPFLESPSLLDDPSSDAREVQYASGVRNMISAASSGDLSDMEAAAAEIEASASRGYPHAQSALGFLCGTGLMRAHSRSKSFLYHHFAAEGGNLQSKMVLAYNYLRQEVHEKALVLYSELAEAAIRSFLILKESPVIEHIRIHSGTEENKEDLRKSRGEADEKFQITEYQALKGDSAAMYQIGLLYYYGLRGVKRDLTRALHWFSKAVEKQNPRAMELLGEMYARGAGVERNYTNAFKWLSLASKHKYYSAYNGLGYLYVKGYGVEKKNYTKAREYFEKAAENKVPDGFYNLGVLYLKGIGVKRNITKACALLLVAADTGQPKAIYLVARLSQKGIGFKKDLHMDNYQQRFKQTCRTAKESKTMKIKTHGAILTKAIV
ncbi:ERAD-associated E3 ubiquitin-protein ligase component HRD3A-like [Curcuma longa]|uniref:ERAD-associated E3 ubiquitin-protein ligase component HRD3A-like n=1 Tax=Curcuma longa TaxID=136217 RepID=UPI003D9F2A5F